MTRSSSRTHRAGVGTAGMGMRMANEGRGMCIFLGMSLQHLFRPVREGEMERARKRRRRRKGGKEETMEEGWRD